MKDRMKDIKYISSLQLNSNRCQVICLINFNILIKLIRSIYYDWLSYWVGLSIY